MGSCQGACDRWATPGKKGGFRVTHFQIRALISPLPVANKPPIGLGATEITEARNVSNVVQTVIDERSKYDASNVGCGKKPMLCMMQLGRGGGGKKQSFTYQSSCGLGA